MPSEVVITGIGVVLPGCNTREALWHQFSTGDSQLTLERDPVLPDQVMACGKIKDFDPVRDLDEIPSEHYLRYSVETQYYMASLLRARRDASLGGVELDPYRVGLFGGSSRPALPHVWERIEGETPFGRRDLMAVTPTNAVGFAASFMNLRGPAMMLSCACASSAAATNIACAQLQSGLLDVAFVSGFELPLLRPLIEIYRQAGLLADARSAPKESLRVFVNHSGNVFGEAAITLVLESRAHAAARGARPLARILHSGFGNDGVHPLRVDAEGARIHALMENAFVRTERSEKDIDVVVGHGNGNRISDLSEEAYMRRVFGDRRADVPLVSIKAIHGHSLGASGVVNIAAAALMLRHDYVAPTINIDVAAASPEANYQANVGAKRTLRHAVAVSYGLGGHSAVTLLAKD